MEGCLNMANEGVGNSSGGQLWPSMGGKMGMIMFVLSYVMMR